MTFKIGKWEFDSYRLKYINLFPSLSAITIMADEPVSVPGSDQVIYPVESRWYQLSVLGRLFGVCVPDAKTKRLWTVGGGPRWSRAKRRWVR